MIKKDVVYDVSSTINRDIHVNEEQLNNDIDKIFQEADVIMDKQKKSLEKLKYKKPKRRLWLKILLWFLVIICMIVAFVVGCIINVKENLPLVVNEFLIGVDNTQKALLTVDDSLLSESEYYQKQMMMLIQAEEMEEILQSVDWNLLKKYVTTQDMSLLTQLIPEEKRAEFDILLQRYIQALEREQKQNSE